MKMTNSGGTASKVTEVMEVMGFEALIDIDKGSCGIGNGG